jgi:hypothetical protein
LLQMAENLTEGAAAKQLFFRPLFPKSLGNVFCLRVV